MTNIVSRLMPTTQPTFVAARPRDAGPIAYLHAASFGRGWEEDEVLRLLLDSAVVTHLAMVRRTMVGFIMSRMAADEAEILKIDQKFANFVTTGDTASATKGTPADFVMVHSDAWTRGQKPLLVDTQESMLKRVTNKNYDVLDFDHIQAEMHGDVAVTIGRYLAHTTGGGNDANPDRAWFAVWFERVYQKRNGQWIYLSHRTVHGPTYGASRDAVSDK